MGSSETLDDGLKKLEYFSLVSKVCSELETHVGCGDKVLAEFITDMGHGSETVEEFDAKLKENGAEMPDYFVRTLLTIIHAILPPKSKTEKKGSEGDGTKETPFPALAIADSRDRARELEQEIEMEAKQRSRDDDHREKDGGGRDRRRDRDRDDRYDRYDRDDRHDKYDRYERNDRRRDREEDERSDSRARRKHHDGHDRRERYDEYAHGGRDREDGDGYGRRRHGDRNGREQVDEFDEDRHDRDRGRGNRDEPELYRVYVGRVSRVMDTGCFVQLNDFRGKEGLVHVSQIANKRVANAKDVVKRDQEVFVKVISMSGQKMSLSMRDVDQQTGKDLLPMKHSSEDDDLVANPTSTNPGPTIRTGLSGITIVEEGDIVSSRWLLKRMSSPEKWEAKQLIASGVLGVKRLSNV